MNPVALVVDDESAMRLLLRDYLEILGYDADLAENGRSAISLGARRAYEVALIDLSLPDISGIEVIRELRERSPSTHCIVVSGNLRGHHDAELAALGIRHYLEKPLGLETLRTAFADLA